MTSQERITQTLKEAFGTSTNGVQIETLSRAVNNSINFDPSLRDMDEQLLESPLRSAGGAMEHSAIMAAIRKAVRDAREFKRKEEERRLNNENRDTVCWGFLLQCWNAFRAHGDVLNVRKLTVSFLAEWLTEKGDYILQDEKDWCALKALEATDTYEGKDKESKTLDAYHEAVVLLVMHKFRRAASREPEKIQALMDTRKEQYGRYSTKRFGFAPDWSVPEKRREDPLQGAFGNDKQKKGDRRKNAGQ